MIDRYIRLEGPRIILRPLTLDDVSGRYVSWLNDPEVNKYLETRFQEQTIETIREYVRAMHAAADVLFPAIILKNGGNHIGNIKLGPVIEEHRRGEISFFIGEKDYWGKGFATEAVRLLTDYALDKLGLNKVTAGCYSNNLGSQRVFEKLRYVIEGRFQRHYR